MVEASQSDVLCFNDLKDISKPPKLLELLEQKIHNLGATNKNFRYKEIFKHRFAMLHETKKRNKTLDFQLFDKEKNSELNTRSDALYNDAYIYYSSTTPIKLETSLNLNENILKEFASLRDDSKIIH